MSPLLNDTMAFYTTILSFLLLLAHSGSCVKPIKSNPIVLSSPPAWVFATKTESDKICGIGIAGPGYLNSPYPKSLARQRSVHNLVGSLATTIREIIIAKQTNHKVVVELARQFQISSVLMSQISHLAITDYWIDRSGIGPFLQKNFHYAHSCIDASKAAYKLALPVSAILSSQVRVPRPPDQPPQWLTNASKNNQSVPLCATGFSLPTYYPEKSFANVVDDIRLQLSTTITTFVSSIQEEIATRTSSQISQTTVASNEALSKGVIVIHYWYDKEGIGPRKIKNSTYGWGCKHVHFQPSPSSRKSIHPTD